MTCWLEGSSYAESCGAPAEGPATIAGAKSVQQAVKRAADLIFLIKQPGDAKQSFDLQTPFSCIQPFRRTTDNLASTACRALADAVRLQLILGATPSFCASMPTAIAISAATLLSSVRGGSNDAEGSFRAGECPRKRPGRRQHHCLRHAASTGRDDAKSHGRERCKRCCIARLGSCARRS